jgi:hypothetical protein
MGLQFLNPVGALTLPTYFVAKNGEKSDVFCNLVQFVG